ncbi:NTP transferase domain-containing protein [Latilactobacillus curvatus]
MNIIVMAAGLGSRFKELTKETPKSLLPVNGVPNLERTIRFINDSNKIEDIYILVGYLGEKFEYLKNKFNNVHIIYNSHFRDYNSIYTFSLALPWFSDSFVIDGDSVLTQNVFSELNPEKSTYYTLVREDSINEWEPIVTNSIVTSIVTASESAQTLSGLSYWKETDCEIIRNNYSKYLEKKYIEDGSLYWDDIPRVYLAQLEITTQKLENKSILEMDNVEEYQRVQEILKEQEK